MGDADAVEPLEPAPLKPFSQFLAVQRGGGLHDDQWGDHRAVFKLVPSPEWLHWLKNDGKLMDQQTFAEHVEEGIVDIADPPGARMLELAQSMQGTVKSTWQSAQRLTDGQVALKYVEEASASAGAHGEVKIPESFLLGLAVFVGEAAYKVTARFRYRVREGRLLLGYKLDRPEEVVLAAVDRMEERLAGQFVGRVFVGTPRQSRHPAATS